ncbi:hypothetical protein C0995_016490 [Termitomyces sp. Mi166|nr:hypothetical protein C0995_016490 [Termitomyces sp. Mi166\
MLKDTNSHHDNKCLHNLLEAALDKDLDNQATEDKINQIVDLKKWANVIDNLDTKQQNELKHICIEADESVHKCQALVSERGGNMPKKKTSSSGGADQAGKANSRSCQTGLPKKREGKSAGNATSSFETATASTSSMTMVTKAKPVVTFALWDEDDNSMAAILPQGSPLCSAIIEEVSGKDLTNEVSVDDYRALHYCWRCLVDGLAMEASVPVILLIDCGAHLTLITPELVLQLGLHTFALKKPEPVSITLSAPNEPKCIVTLTHYMKLSMASMDNRWNSKTIVTLMASGLCAPLVLGIPWLKKNSIVINYEAMTCVDKNANYDLFNLPALPAPPPRPRLWTKDILNQVCADQKAMLAELKYVCAERYVRLKHMNLFKDILPVNVVAAIQGRICQLAEEKKLIKLDTSLKAEFKEIFEPILHAEMLPMDVFMEIHLKKDSEKVYCRILTHAYQCPRKYQSVFQTLIQQHLDAGQI